MDVKKIRKELNWLLKNIVEHSESFPANRPIPSLEVSAVISKVSKMQERLNILRYLLETQENQQKNTPSQKQHSSQKEELVEIENNVLETNVTENITERKLSANEIPEATQQKEKTEEKSTTVLENMQTKQEIAQKFSRTSIKTLKDAFSLNDRYLYANELFDKNMEAFNVTVKSIDECASLDEAITIFNRLKEQSNWDEENTFYLEFIELIERRFNR
ncbi:MAG: hypothetical protein K0B10_10360 [Vicingaceae bacterium]|nr:hypothetical protein [Vicingaceae bacterium]